MTTSVCGEVHKANSYKKNNAWNLQILETSIFLASSGSFNVKNDNIDTSFSLFSLQILNLPALLQIIIIII